MFSIYSENSLLFQYKSEMRKDLLGSSNLKKPPEVEQIMTCRCSNNVTLAKEKKKADA